MNYDEFLDSNFGTVVGTVVVTLEDTPLIREIKGHYFIWITESIAISKRKSFAWEISEYAAKVFKDYKAANINIEFKNIDGHETIIDTWKKQVIFSK